jgi:hypothetical protein
MNDRTMLSVTPGDYKAVCAQHKVKEVVEAHTGVFHLSRGSLTIIKPGDFLSRKGYSSNTPLKPFQEL